MPGSYGWLGIAVCTRGFVRSPQGLADASRDLKQPRKNSIAEQLDQVCDCNDLFLFRCSLQQSSAKEGFSPSPAFALFFHVPETRGFWGCHVLGALECPALNLANQTVQYRTWADPLSLLLFLSISCVREEAVCGSHGFASLQLKSLLALVFKCKPSPGMTCIKAWVREGWC